jgi:hypothetical protein
VSPVYKKGPGGGYWYYWVPAVALTIFVIAALLTDGFGTGAA